MSEERFWELDRDGRIWWGENGNNIPAPKIFLSEVLQGRVPQTIWTYQEVGHSQDAKKEVLEYVAFEDTDNVLDTVKPTRLIQRILQIATTPKDNDIVLDFFAGSASTAHAVIAQNQADGGNRQFICVQFPELLPKPEPTLRTIADIGKVRIRTVVSRMRAEAAGRLDLHDRDTPIDLGFRVFRLAQSNFRNWEGVARPTAEDYAAQMALFSDLLLGEWQTDNVIWETALKEGFAPNARVARIDGLPQNTIYQVFESERERSFFICLDSQLHPETIKALPLAKDDLFVCRDAALTDAQAANLALQCRLKTL